MEITHRLKRVNSVYHFTGLLCLEYCPMSRRELDIYSESVGEKLHLTIWDNGEMTARSESGVFYSAKELKLMKDIGKKVPKEVHILKAVFGGTLINCKNSSFPPRKTS